MLYLSAAYMWAYVSRPIPATAFFFKFDAEVDADVDAEWGWGGTLCGRCPVHSRDLSPKYAK